MTININKLMQLEIPVGHQTLTASDIALYGLSIGLGRDPLDVRQLAYVDPLQGPAVMPTMVLIMAHPGFYLSDPESGVDSKSVLHAEQSIEILAPIPSKGEVESHTHITDVVDKGAGKAALIFAETELFDEGGGLFARLKRTTFIKEGGGFGGAAKPKQPIFKHVCPEGQPDHVIDLETVPEQALLYRLNGDLNPLHSDPGLARNLGFERPILHGLCTMGVVCHAILRALGNYRADALRRMQLCFTKPVYPGETIRTEIWNDGSFRAFASRRNTIVIDGGLAVLDSPEL